MTNTQNNIKKVTPLHDRTWYVKWFSVGLIICAVLCRSVDEVPKFYDVVFSFFGTAGWLWVGYMWHDRALIVLNTILISMLSLSLFRYFVI
jgi:hypothetical protein|tara:strand:+ start:155 stop:427 length:273 start_codon:yes stop_codon:yes gene_type:complete